MPRWTIRRLTPADSIEELTILINRAYAEHVPNGYNPTGSYQDAETTRERIGRGVCFVAEMDGRLVGTAVRHEYEPDADDPLIYKMQGVAILGQFAVDPGLRKNGIGAALCDAVAQEALSQGYRELALDTIETAAELVEYYLRRGFKPVGLVQWSGKTYRSLVMSKPLVEKTC